MIKRLLKSTFLFFLLGILSCGNTKKEDIQAKKNVINPALKNSRELEIKVGANRTTDYYPLLKNKNIGVVGNQTSLMKLDSGKYVHLVDTLLNAGFNINKVFAPEHGFRGTADAGEYIKDGRDSQTGLPVISLYGNNKKPSAEQLQGIDIMLFDIQDVGARFYTYISTLHYIMEACAENNIPLIVLDRPNPNGHYIDGPLLEPEHSSFVGMHPVPIVHGMTIGEYAQMINGETWLKNGVNCSLKVIPLENYTHEKEYSLPVKPSPNLPNDRSINLYPSLCFFEGTTVNAGRGTNKQFQVFGSPFLNEDHFPYKYTPVPMDGAKNPKHEGKICYGRDLSDNELLSKLDLSWLIGAYNNTSDKDSFFNSFFTKLAGTEKLQQQIEDGISEEEIRSSWQVDLEEYRTVRQNYLLYP